MKLLLNLKKHEQQDDTIKGSWSYKTDNVQHILCRKSKTNDFSVSFGLIISELRKLCT